MRALLRKFIVSFLTAVHAIVTKFRTKLTFLDIKPLTRLRGMRAEENIAAVLASVNDDHQLSIVAVCSNWASVSQQRGKFCRTI